jgi:hypothetical protein
MWKKKKKGNGIIQIAYLKKAIYYEHQHYHLHILEEPKIISQQGM